MMMRKKELNPSLTDMFSESKLGKELTQLSEWQPIRKTERSMQ